MTAGSTTIDDQLSVRYQTADATKEESLEPVPFFYEYTAAVFVDTGLEGSIMEIQMRTHSGKGMFLHLAEQWRLERPATSSSMAEKIACLSYLRIIAMGVSALPLIIEQLERERDDPDHWGPALEAITGENPVPEDARGDTVRTAQAWMAWSKTRAAAEWTSISIRPTGSLTSTKTTVGSLVPKINDTIALLGQPNPVFVGGGQVIGDIGLRALNENLRSTRS